MRTGIIAKLVDKFDKIINPATEETLQEIQANTSRFATNEILEDNGDTFFFKETKSGEWYIMKIDANSVFTHATIINNPSITTYADARLGYATLVYGTFNEAF